ncbi:MgtC/SapB family protein [Variovorax dokdonensis]|uniref:Protein MgtC n=1 Tax=Variovorax dokdonensis TaxID=344883 RepID=A0ABT7N5M0_9BURK|nr:MgtC/SapB family protein [Variovorax dokdonensis]MDM0043222.1 MgtC/SapB family protein [Variovorax dokdonensis]
MSEGAWATFTATLAAEFSDVDDVEHFTRVAVRLMLAGALGFALGFERESQGKAAGARTHMLVSMGSAMFVLAAQTSGISVADMSRVVQGLVAGVGFLCAGAILKNNGSDAQVHGLTTAAGMWMTAAIGMACGLGREVTAIIATVLGLVVLALVPHFSKSISGVLGGGKDAEADKADKASPDDRG